MLSQAMQCKIDAPIVEAPWMTFSNFEVVMMIFMMFMVIALSYIILMMKKTQDTLWWCMDRADKASNKLEFVESRHMRANCRGHELIRI